MNIKTCRHCDVSFQREDAAPIPHDRCERCHEEIEAMKTPLCADGRPCGQQDHPDDDAYCHKCPHEPKRAPNEALGQPPGIVFGIATAGDAARALKHFGRSATPPTYDPADVAFKPLPKQPRYQNAKGDDWIDEFARTATPEEFRGAMRFTVGKYLRRAGKKDSLLSEVRKMRDYCQRWEQYEQELEQ